MPPLFRSWPQALVHIDGDAFFASCEQAINPSLKGKPVVTGKERNIVATASYQARAFGIHLGVELWEAKKMCPELVVLPSDYETYSLFSKRMFEIMRRFTPAVEEYGIDEAFADITGLRRVHHCSYPAIAQKMQEAIMNELGISVSVGLSLTKTLAKTASKKNKPKGLVVASAHEREALLADLPIEDVWNIGPNTAELLKRFGVTSALAFAQKPESFIQSILSKPGRETWQELNGVPALEFVGEEKESYQSISKTKTFTPPSADKEYVYAQLMKNVESSCMKARRYHQAPRKISLFLKRQDHRSFGIEAKLLRASAFPNELSHVLRQLFEELFVPNTLYRATGILLYDLVAAAPLQASLFEEPNYIQKTRRLYDAIDSLRERFGKYSVSQASSLVAQKTQHLTDRGDVPQRKLTLLKGETKRQRLPLPLLQVEV